MNKLIRLTGLILYLLFTAHLYASLQKNDSFVSNAWQALAENKQQEAENYFVSAINADQKNSRAYLGLSYLYNLQAKYDQSWLAFEKALQIENNIYPYIYSAWITRKMTSEGLFAKDHAIRLLKELSQNADSSGILKAMANEVLGQYYQRKGDLSRAKQYYRNMNALTEWMLIGPFDNVSASGFDKQYSPELEFSASKIYSGKNGIPIQWFKIAAVQQNSWIDFRRYFDQFQAIYYANNFVFSSTRQKVQIRVGTSGSVKTFLNDEIIIECFDETNNDLETYVVETELQEGWNRLLIKCGFSEIQRCNFLARITDGSGNPVSGLKVSIEAKSYLSKPGAPKTVVQNFAQVFFRAKIKENPDHLENYLLLADCYLRNDNAIEAELVLKDALKNAPDCVLLLTHILEAYLRGEKYDEYETTVQKVLKLDKNVPYVIKKKINDYIENKELDKAEELIPYLEKLLPESEDVYQIYFKLYAAKDQSEKIIALCQKAYQKYPSNWTFVYTEALISIGSTRKYDHAIKILEKYLQQKNDEEALITLAEIYLQASDILKWEKTYRKIFEDDPSATGYYYRMADTYSVLQNYANAEMMIQNGLALAPNVSLYWAKLGEIYRAQKRFDLSRESYYTALKFRPTNYDARLALRDLEGKKQIFAHFQTVNIDSLIKICPNQDAFPDDDGIILLDDSKRVVYETGASESSEELLIKLFNNRGIDIFKEYWIDYNSYTEELTVEKAVVIKPDGSEINADIDNNQLVFKSLTPNDVIYMKWKIKNYYFGRLSNHFWDTVYLNSFYPMKLIRYSLLTPKDFKFQYRTQNITIAPVKKVVDEGTVYQWTLSDEPSIKYEYDMPGLTDVGKILNISSIHSWEDVVDWYIDLSTTKTRSAYEIKEQVFTILKDATNLSEGEKIKRIYDFITENVRYSNVFFRQSRLIPQKARDVLVNRIGDCKDKTTLFIAMLKEIGVNAHYVLINTIDQGQNINSLPSLAFNHCIAAIETKTGIRYADLTAYNHPIGTVPNLDLDGFALMIKSGVKQPFFLPKSEFLPRNISRQIVVKVKDDHSIYSRVKSIRFGSMTASTRDYYRDKGEEEQRKELTETLTEDLPRVKLLSFDIENLDKLEPELQYEYSYEVPDYISEVGQFKLLKIPWSDKKKANKALSYDARKYPLCYWSDSDTLIEEIEIQLPLNFAPIDLAKQVSYSCAIANYTVTYNFVSGAIKGKRTEIIKKTMVQPNEYLEFKEFWNNVLKEDNRQILLKKL